MGKWEEVNLVDVTSVITCGVAKRPEYVNEGIMFLSSKNVKEDRFHLDDFNCISEKDYMSLTKYSKPEKGDILYTRVGSFGEAAVIDFDIDFAIFVSLTLIKPIHEKVFNRYLMYYLNSSKTKQHAIRNTSGIGVQNLNVSVVREYKVPIPPLETQKQIAKTLDTAAELLTMRKQQLVELDNLLKSTFYDMFGDPVTNGKGWKTNKFGDFATLINGRAYKQEELLKKGKTPVLRVGNFFSNRDWYYSDLDLEVNKYCDKGDLLYAWSASFGPKIWDGPKVIYHYHIWKVVLNDEVNKQFVFSLLKYTTEKLKEGTHGIAMMHLTKGGMEQTYFIVPSISLQNKFAEIVTKIEEQKALVKKAIAETQYLFDSLMSEYFE